MSDYNIRIGVDSRSASRGVKQFAADLNGALKALRDFDKRASDAFKALERFSKINTGSLSKSVKTIGAAVREINGLNISRALVNNLQALQKALAGLRFSGKNNLKALPAALNGLQSIKINPRLVSSLVQMKAALKGFSGPPKSLSGLAPLLRSIATIRLNTQTAAAIAALKNALAGFQGPSARAGTNLHGLISAMASANPSQIAAVAAALHRLNGLNINIGRSLANIGRAGTGAFGGMAAGITRSHFAMRALDRQMSVTYHAATLLQAALGGLSVGTVVNGIYKVGSSFQSLERTLAAIASTATETGNHMGFLEDMVTRIPVSLDSVAASYGKFAVAARLSGMSVGDTQNIFEGFSTAFAAMGVSGQTAELGFLALQQIISKGRVSMEELRQQLGEHLPGAMQLLADSLDVPTEKLIKMIENGEVGADSLIKFAERAKQQFGPSLASAFNTASGQLVILQNKWTMFQRTVFENGFESGLASMFKSLADAMGTPDFDSFAKKLGAALGEVFQTIGVLGALIIENRDKVLLFIGAFAGWAAISAFAAILTFMISPLARVASGLFLAGRAAGAFFAIMGGARFLAAVAGVQLLGTTVGLLTKRTLQVAAAGLAAAYALDVAFNDGKGLKSMLGYIGKVSGALGEMVGKGFESFGVEDTGLNGMIEGYKQLMKESDTFATKVEQNSFESRKQQDINAARERRNAEAKAKALTNEEQKLWENISPVAAANEEYVKQLKLLDAIAQKTGTNVGDLKKVLDAQTLEDRDPVRSLVEDYKMELDAMKAKTGEQQALLEAKRVEQDMLKKGIILTREQVEAIGDYHKGIAMMNGEIGNGIERWTTTVGDFNDNLQDAISEGISGLSDEITNFVTGAEADFLGLARSILRTFVKISLDSLLKDLFSAMGMNGEKNGANMAEQALSKLAGIGENIMTAQTNVYTTGLSVNGMPLTSPNAGMPLADQYSAYGAGKKAAPNSDMTLAQQYGAYGAGKRGTVGGMLTGMDRPAGTKSDPIVVIPKMTTTPKTDRLPVLGAPSQERFGYPMPTPSQERFGYPPASPAGVPIMPAATPAKQNTPASAASLNLPAPGGNRDFLNQMYARARAKGLADPQARLMASQAALESGWGKSGLMKKANNVFGMKAGKSWQGDTIHMPTKEQRSDGSWYTENAKWRKYGSVEESISDKEKQMNRLWPESQKATTFEGAAAGLRTGQKGGYATDLNYVSKISKINQKIDPNNQYMQQVGQPAAAPKGLDPMATGSIDQVNQKLTTLGTTAQTAGTQVGTAGTKLRETGTSAQTLAPALTQTQTAAQQAAMAAQTKGSADQMAAMQTQMAGQSVGMAGQQASSASPQFQQAGTALASAGQQASMAGAAAQGATPGMGGFGSGISALLGPLSQAIPGLGQFGGMLMQLLQSLMGGMGGGMGGGLYAEGGISGSPVSSASLPSGAWSSAPHFNEGTPNTSGGMPAILHPNEAVIPLTRGREVPVEINDGEPRQDNLDKRGGRSNTTIILNGVTDMDSFKRSKRQLEYGVSSAQYRSQFRNG